MDTTQTAAAVCVRGAARRRVLRQERRPAGARRPVPGGRWGGRPKRERERVRERETDRERQRERERERHTHTYTNTHTHSHTHTHTHTNPPPSHSRVSPIIVY